MTQTYNLDQLIVTSTSAVFEKRLEKELVIGKLAKADFRNGMNHGDEVNVIMPANVTMSKWDGGDLKAPEKVASSIVKVPVNQGRQVNFELEEAKAKQIEEAGQTEKGAKLISEYSSDALYQARDAVDSYLGGLYGLAGSTETKIGNAAIELTNDKADLCYAILANVKAKMSRFNVWKSDKMLAILPPEMIAIMLGMNFMQYTEMQVKDKALGEISKKAGFRIFESCNVAQTGSSGDFTYYPLFGVEGETFAAPIQKNLKLIPYMRDESLNKAYKGGFIFGGSVPNSKKLATAKVKITLNKYE